MLRGLIMAWFLLVIITSNGLQLTSDGLQPTSIILRGLIMAGVLKMAWTWDAWGATREDPWAGSWANERCWATNPPNNGWKKHGPQRPVSQVFCLLFCD